MAKLAADSKGDVAERRCGSKRRAFAGQAKLRYDPVMARSSSAVTSVRLLRSPTVDGIGVMCVTERKGDVCYAFREIPCEIGGRGFSVHRLGLGSLYHVRIDGAVESSCECMGYLSHGRCRHIFALRSLMRDGEL